MWTGSWRTVRVVIDPVGTTTLTAALRAAVEQQLDAVHLIGEDVEVRAPEYVPLIIEVAVCISSEYWIDDVSPVIEAGVLNSYTRMASPPSSIPIAGHSARRSTPARSKVNWPGFRAWNT